MSDLSGKRIVITGGNGALGSSVARVARQKGGTPVLLDIQFAEDIASTYECHVVDLCNASTTAECLQDLGEIDAVVNIAGGFAMGPSVWEETDESWDKLFALNVTTMRNVIKAIVPAMKAQSRGAIVNIGAYAATCGKASMGCYTASKSVVMRLTESLADELRGDGINVNAVLPTIIDTPTNRADMPDADFGEWVHPEDLAEVICFLISDAAKAVHGALVPVRGLS